MMTSDICPTCGLSKEGLARAERLETDAVRWLRETNAAAADSCVWCVEKHIGKAMVLWDEITTSGESGMEDGTAVVNVYRNHILVIGNLGAAVDESVEYGELHELLKKTERMYRYYGTAPDWKKILELLETVKGGQVEKRAKEERQAKEARIKQENERIAEREARRGSVDERRRELEERMRREREEMKARREKITQE